LPEKSVTIFTEASSEKGNLQGEGDVGTVRRSDREILSSGQEDIKKLFTPGHNPALHNQFSPSKDSARRKSMLRKSIAEHFKLLNAF
jgi:hypothetical protein